MSKTTQLIDEITHEARNIRHLTEELKERYRTMGALLISARSLVPPHRWRAWLEANLEMDSESVEVVLESDFSDVVPNLPVLLKNNDHPLLEDKQTKRENHHPQHPVPKRRGRPPKNHQLL